MREIETSLHTLTESELTPRGFEWTKALSRPGKAWVRRDARSGVSQMILPVVTVYGPHSATVVFSFYLIVDSLQSLEAAWSQDPLFKKLNPVDGALPFTLAAATLKDCPGGSVLGLSSAADVEANGEQAQRILLATVEWLERFSNLRTLQTFLETASPEQLGMATMIPSRRDSLLLQLYYLGGDVEKVRALAAKILAGSDEGNILWRAVRARAAVALARTLDRDGGDGVLS